MALIIISVYAAKYLLEPYISRSISEYSENQPRDALSQVDQQRPRTKYRLIRFSTGYCTTQNLAASMTAKGLTLTREDGPTCDGYLRYSVVRTSVPDYGFVLYSTITDLFVPLSDDDRFENESGVYLSVDCQAGLFKVAYPITCKDAALSDCPYEDLTEARAFHLAHAVQEAISLTVSFKDFRALRLNSDSNGCPWAEEE